MRSGLGATMLLLMLLLTAVVSSERLAAQGRGSDPQSRLLRDAATLESQGDLDGAEVALRRLLELEPSSAGALFALARVLRGKGELAELRPLVDHFLAREPSVAVRALKLELLVEADSTRGMVAEAERWISADPRETTFTAVSRVYERALGPERALDVLRRGRATLGENALALETGDLLAAQGDIEGAVAEWALAVGDDGSGLERIRGRLDRLGEGRRDEAGRLLVTALGEANQPGRRRATLRVALDVGLEAESLELARQYAEGLSGRARVTFLNEVGILARESDLPAVATWAYSVLRNDASSPEERRQFDERLVDVALETGDTVGALEAQRRVVASYPERSDEWRRARAETILLEATLDQSDMADSWSAFRADFPNAPELDVVAAAIAVSLQARGDVEGAASVLEGIEGPRSALERAYLSLASGEIEEGTAVLLMAVSGLSPSEATPIIQLLSLLGRLSEAGARVLAAAGVAAHRGHAAEAAAALAEEIEGLELADRAPLLAEAARLAERGGDVEGAAELRMRLVDEHSEAPEVAEATLALARHMAESGGGRDKAIRLLEDLITRRPNAAVVPEARLELERLRNRPS